QSVEAIMIAYAQALLVDQVALAAAQADHDVVRSQNLLQDAFRTDVRPLVAEARLRNGGALDPIRAFRELGCRGELIRERGVAQRASGL
ncbi:MAG: sugar isomerase, partial [Bacteroidota bacterium]